MTEPKESREQEISRALRQLTADHQQGRLSFPTYRRLRHTLLDSVEKGEVIPPLSNVDQPFRARPGPVVWLAVAAIVLLLVLLGWLLR